VVIVGHTFAVAVVPSSKSGGRFRLMRKRVRLLCIVLKHILQNQDSTSALDLLIAFRLFTQHALELIAAPVRSTRYVCSTF
jgi:hypothetical protein